MIRLVVDILIGFTVVHVFLLIHLEVFLLHYLVCEVVISNLLISTIVIIITIPSILVFFIRLLLLIDELCIALFA